jgi:glycosyltransferase involved in cell wall biosynthesis
VGDQSLHVVVDGRELVGRPTGVGRHLESILRAWAGDASFRHRLTILVPGAAPPMSAGPAARFTWQTVPASSTGTWFEQTTLARVAKAASPDVFLAPGYTAPLRLNVPTVVTVHDVSFFAHPEWFSAREGLRRRWLTRASARRARRVITVSAFSAGEIVRWLGVPRERVVVAPNGAPPLAEAADSPSRGPVVLYVGSLFNRRRIPELLEGFARAAASVPDARLVLVGDNRTHPPLDPCERARALGVADRVRWREYVADDELARLYAEARVFVFLSDYEGFAMTPFEAIAHGVPPIMLDTPVAREIYGDAARLVTASPDDIGAALRHLLEDETARLSLARAGRQRMAQFSWARSADLIRRALEEAARER